MTLLRLIADDLTGALDSATQFTGSAGPLPVLLRAQAPWPEGSFALDLSCRDGVEAMAVAAAVESSVCYRGADVAFKKIDSLLRGHWAAELAALSAAGLFRRIVLAPAFPAQHRVTRGGRQAIEAPDGETVVLDIDPVAELSRRGVIVLRDGEQGRSEPGERTPVHLFDASTQEDLDAIVRLNAAEGPILWCGAAGLARALAGAPPARVAPEGAAHLVVIGSNHPVTRTQIEVLGRDQAHLIRLFDADGRKSADRLAETMARHGRCVALADLPVGLAPDEAANCIAGWFAAMVPYLDPPQILTVVGGETFAAVCRGLGATVVTVEGEYQPGVPGSRMASGLWDGTRCFSKSGAFGDAAWLSAFLAS
jgi:uncharacterized protein YgbK (DUF1537 family)